VSLNARSSHVRLAKRRSARRSGKYEVPPVPPTLDDLPEIEPDIEYRGYTITVEKVDFSPEMWRADVFVRDVLVWPLFDATKARAIGRAVQLIDRQEAAQGRSGVRRAAASR